MLPQILLLMYYAISLVIAIFNHGKPMNVSFGTAQMCNLMVAFLLFIGGFWSSHWGFPQYWIAVVTIIVAVIMAICSLMPQSIKDQAKTKTFTNAYTTLFGFIFTMIMLIWGGFFTGFGWHF